MRARRGCRGRRRAAARRARAPSGARHRVRRAARRRTSPSPACAWTHRVAAILSNALQSTLCSEARMRNGLADNRAVVQHS
eukprot:5700931-Pleurochrysis_carterae.AAC.1